MPDHPLRVAVCAVAPLMPFTSGSAVASARQDTVERAIVAAVSHERSTHGLPRVHPMRALAGVADRHSWTMARTGVLTHGAFVRRLAPVVPGRRMGETIAYATGTGRSMALRVVRGWMQSPVHRGVLLDPALSDVGVARRSNRRGWFVTADFAG
jgi:uncharacterized protein YkwD